MSCPPYFDLEQYSDDPRDLSVNCTKNDINFQNYRKFTADSTITFGK